MNEPTPAEPSTSAPDFIQRAAYTVGPYAAAWLLLQIPLLGDLLPGDATADQQTLAAGIVGTLLWGASYAWRWATSRLSRPALPDAIGQLNGWTDAMLTLAAAASHDEREADAVLAADLDSDTADLTGPGISLATTYDTAPDYEP